MYFEVYKEGVRTGTAFMCHGCGDTSRPTKTAKLPPRWVNRTESCYGANGLSCKGWVENYYCSHCNSIGCSAKTVAATTRKFYKQKQKKAKRASNN